MKTMILTAAVALCMMLSGCLSLSYDRNTPSHGYAHAERYRDSGDRPYDRDGDGVPNGYDRAPDNPYRR